MTYKATLRAYYSKRDRTGNCYWSACYIDHATGHTIRCNLGNCGESNIRNIPYHLNGQNFEPRNVLYTVTELAIREYNTMTKDWPYLGSGPEDIAAEIRKQLEVVGA